MNLNRAFAALVASNAFASRMEERRRVNSSSKLYRFAARSVGASRARTGRSREANAVSPLSRTVAVAVLTFASGVIGFFLQGLLPLQALTDAKGMVGSITGLVIL